VLGEPFQQDVVPLLRRQSTAAIPVARALSTLGEWSSMKRISAGSAPIRVAAFWKNATSGFATPRSQE
jgi:hypothetical protein